LSWYADSAALKREYIAAQALVDERLARPLAPQ
jgi:hypothetical protein